MVNMKKYEKVNGFSELRQDLHMLMHTIKVKRDLTQAEGEGESKKIRSLLRWRK